MGNFVDWGDTELSIFVLIFRSLMSKERKQSVQPTSKREFFKQKKILIIFYCWHIEKKVATFSNHFHFFQLRALAQPLICPLLHKAIFSKFVFGKQGFEPGGPPGGNLLLYHLQLSYNFWDIFVRS